MRFRSFVLLLLVLGVLAWAAWTIVAAGSSYLEVSGLVEQAVTEAAKRRKAAWGVAGRSDTSMDIVSHVRSGVIAGARQAGIPIDERSMEVVELQRGVRVSVKWPIPAVTFQGQIYLTLPMSFTGTFTTT
ncbi:MAG TPA: hypothetical protein VML54_07135 [Candidatus Limnocylindrales bacterium]|nr:hypothetical protein [Candidatus Limnocylindrales bacterium]